MNIRMKLLGSVLGAMLAIFLIPSQANALVRPATVSTGTNVAVSSSPLTVVAIDNAVAAKAGNRVQIENGYKVLYDGITGAELARVAIGSGVSRNAGTISPYNTVTGNCGTSYIYLQNLNNLQYQFSTGWDLYAGSAYDFNWSISVTASWTFPHSGSYYHEWSDAGPMWPSQHWTSGWKTSTTTAPSGTNHFAQVISGTVYKTDGAVCHAGSATAATYIW